MNEERTHHPFSPSKLQSLEVCPCWDSKSSEHERTVAGTKAHASAEAKADDATLGDDDAFAVAQCLDFFERRKQLMVEARGRAVDKIKDDDTGSCILVPTALAKEQVPQIAEMQETYLAVDDENTTAGYFDKALIAHDGKYAEIFDWKFGLWAVEKAENNLQGIAYSLGMFEKFKTLESVRFFFYQPHLDTITEAVFTREQVPALLLRVRVVVERAKQARASGNFEAAVPTTPGCTFCANLGRCPKVADFACRVASKFFPLEFPQEITPTMLADRKNTTLALRLAAVVAIWAGAYRKQVTERVICGDTDMPAGYRLQTKSDRDVVDIAKYKEIALQYLTEAEYTATLTVGLGKIEKQISEHAPRGSKTAQVKEFNKQAEEAGAIKRGEQYSFLVASATKD